MAARNYATTEFCKLMEAERLAELKELAQLAVQIQDQGEIDYAEQPKDVLNELKKACPVKMWNVVHGWGNALPVHVLCLAAMELLGEPGLKTFMALTKSICHLNDSETAEKILNLFLDALENAYGAETHGQAATANRAVYPDPGGTSRPMIPQVDDVKELCRITVREWLRLYLN
ncbi:hypothetical protein FRC08_018583 [Ceratobasidium sp. 394]|nr:hypothetical protein FRC08_018583 [Ceratobasidium sp. 394]